ncbi:GNAT family N-acetyltransferase [Streptomyces sp. 796.1]|uniref:GNAT family N-acetyltransferase n=1 Tax=Streptomyces sp. 796.1 TaxID=3163029 RepID=UPI0039C96DE2
MSEREERAHGADQGRDRSRDAHRHQRRDHGPDQSHGQRSDRDAHRDQRPEHDHGQDHGQDRDQGRAPSPGRDLAKSRDPHPHPEHDPEHARAADDGSGRAEGHAHGQVWGQSSGQSQDRPREHRPDDQPAPGISAPAPGPSDPTAGAPGTTAGAPGAGAPTPSTGAASTNTPTAGTPTPSTPTAGTSGTAAPATSGATAPSTGTPSIDTPGTPATGAAWGASHLPGAGAAGIVPPARAADPEHAAVPDGVRPLPVPEQAGTHRAPRAPSEPPPRGPRAVLVEGNRFRLRELHPTDVNAVLAVFGDPGTSHAFGTRPLQRFDAVALIEHAVATSRQRPRTHYRLGISRVDTGELIGTAKLVLDRSTPDPLVRTGHRSAEVGVAFRADQASIGHGMDVGYLLGLLGFGRLGLHRMWAGFLPTNTTGQRIAATVGMTREGLLRHHGYANGTWHDIVQYAILEHDWHARIGRGPHPSV